MSDNPAAMDWEGRTKYLSNNSSLEAYRRYRTCTRKRVYETMQHGWKIVENIQKNGNDRYPDFELRPYQCEFCNNIHVGHSRTPRATEVRLKSLQETKK